MGSTRTFILARSLNYSLGPQRVGARRSGSKLKNGELLTAAAPSTFNAERKLGVVYAASVKMTRQHLALQYHPLFLITHRARARTGSEKEDGEGSLSLPRLLRK